MYVCGSVTLRNVNEMHNAMNVSTLADACYVDYHNDRRGQSEMPSYPEEEEAKGKDDGRKAKK